jgi:hypothetical protein
VTIFTNLDERHCHKWALLLQERKKLAKASLLMGAGDFRGAKTLFNEIFFGVSGKQADPGMAGSLLYHIAMVTKMETESRILLEEFGAASPETDQQLPGAYGDFVSDVVELSKSFLPLTEHSLDVSSRGRLGTEEKIQLYTALYRRTREIGFMVDSQNLDVLGELEVLFQDWRRRVVENAVKAGV